MFIHWSLFVVQQSRFMAPLTEDVELCIMHLKQLKWVEAKTNRQVHKSFH